ncbi:hypothetical protein WCD74_21640 [Actinomycetospora sp. OC33-EN08]|uniref:Glycosyltransferase RgtA/B/C/D-like domain-containing protein n=1 Tax=Actinomycetospora aurantiaca TaxID=3129233 RepID=A0ABU8MTW5_9PSEU
MTLARGAAAPSAPAHENSERGSWRLPKSCWFAVYGAFLGVALFVLAWRTMPDDALITLSFARNLAQHGCWCLASGVESNTATSPLNVWLLAAVVLTTGKAFWAAAVVLSLSLALLALWCHRLGGAAAAVLGPLAIATAPVFASAVGMETVLVAAVLVGLAVYALEGRPVATGVMVGAAWLARPDILVPAVVLVVGATVVLRTPRLLASLPLGALLVSPWVLFSWWHFGSAWPNSVAVKWANGTWGGRSITDVSFFWEQWPLVTAVTVATMACGAVATVLAGALRAWPSLLTGLAGIAHLAALATQETPPIFYYAGPSLAGLTLATVLLCSRARTAVVVASLLVAASVVVLIANGSWWLRGIGPIRENWATNEQYAAIARDLPTDAVVLGGEIGGLAFYCADRCRVVDPVLSDPGRTDVLIAKFRREHPRLSALNYVHYDPPPIIPVVYRVRAGVAAPGPGPSWPITRNPGWYQWAILERVENPLQVAN